MCFIFWNLALSIFERSLGLTRHHVKSAQLSRSPRVYTAPSQVIVEVRLLIRCIHKVPGHPLDHANVPMITKHEGGIMP